MVVSLEQASTWEWGYFKDDRYATLNGDIKDHFVQMRLKDWPTRLSEYWTWVAQKDATNQQQQHQQQKDDDECERLEEWTAFGGIVFLSFVSDYPEDRPRDEPDVLRLKDLKRRRALALFRFTRIGTEFHGFMHLPREIRDMIYAYALVRDQIVVPNESASDRRVMHTHNYEGQLYQRYAGLRHDFNMAWRYGKLDRPTFDLILGVNRQVQQEAMQVFYSRNLLIFPAGDCTFPTLRRLAGISLSGRFNGFHLARRVSYPFDMRDVKISDYESRYDCASSVNSDENMVTPQEFLQRIHDYKLEHLQSTWWDGILKLTRMELDLLQISLEECYCGMGCCRQVDWVCDQLRGHDDDPFDDSTRIPWASRPPKVIEIIGWTNDAEKEMIKETLEPLRKILPTIEIQFYGKSKAELRAIANML